MLINNSKFIDKFTNVINIDHHDSSENSINASLSIIDYDASSTCEMIASFIRENEGRIAPRVATVLLAGIVLDTNGFSISTTADTFYYSSYLMMNGADNTEVQYLLKQDLKAYLARQKVLTSAKIIKNIAISKGLQTMTYRREDLARIADTLLLFNNIEASFVIGKISKNEVGISARSFGDFNVKNVMESFGGGGDEEGAAARVTDMTTNEIYNELIKIINKK